MKFLKGLITTLIQATIIAALFFGSFYYPQVTTSLGVLCLVAMKMHKS